MPVSISRNVRYAFAALLLGLALYAGLDALAASALPDTLSSCGTEENPCALAPLNVSAGGPVAAAEAVPAAALHQAAAPVRKRVSQLRGS